MKKLSALLNDSLKSGERVKVKLLGDSITHGVGGKGFVQKGERIIEGFDFFRNPEGFCWARLMSEHLGEKYGAVVVNNGCSGVKIEFIIENFDALVDEDDDFVICTIGTNNRHQYKVEGPKRDRGEMIETFYQNVLKLNRMFVERDIPVVFVANIPASAYDEIEDKADYWRILHMDDINREYKRAREAAGFELISLYDLVSEYVSARGILIDDLLRDGLHPNDDGYRVMFELLKAELEI